MDAKAFFDLVSRMRTMQKRVFQDTFQIVLGTIKDVGKAC